MSLLNRFAVVLFLLLLTSFVVTGQITITPTITPVSCGTGNNGAISLSVSGGTSPYTYSWSTGGSGSSLVSLSPGTYSVTVTDNANNTKAGTYTVGYDMVWSNIVNATVSGGTITSTNNNFISGGTSTNKLLSNTNGWVEFLVGSTNTAVYGLSSDPKVVGYTDINYAFYSNSTGLYLYELGTQVASSISYSIGDRLRIQRSNDTIRYYKNGTVLRTVAGVNAGLTLQVDVSFGTTSYAFQNTRASFCRSLEVIPAIVPTTCNSSTGSITLTVSGGATPYTYSWNTGDTTSHINGLSSGTYTCTVTDFNGITKTNTYNVGNVINWTNLVNATASGGTLTSSSTTSSGTSSNTLIGNANGWVEFEVKEKNNIFYGFSNIPSTTSYTDMEYAFETHPTSGAYIIESGVVRVSYIPYNIGDRFKISRSNDTIRYYKNGAVLRTVPGVNKALSLSVDVSFSYNGYVLQNTNASFCTPVSFTAAVVPTTCNGSTGSIALTATGGKIPYTYSWSTGATTPSITGLSSGTYTCTVTDSNGVAKTSSYNVGNIISWADMVNSTASGGTLTSSSTTSSGTSTNVLASNADGWVEFEVNQKNSVLYGLSSNPSVVGYTDINYAFYTQPGAGLAIYELGIPQVNNIPYEIGDHLRIQRSNDTIRYYRNGLLLRTVSGVNKALSLRVDVSFLYNGYVLQNVNASFCTPVGFTATVVPTNCSNSTGSISITTSGGRSPYTYSWSTGATTSSITGLSSGTYTCTVTDSNGVAKTRSYNVGNVISWTDMVNSTASGGTITSSSTTSSGTSTNALASNTDGWVEFEVREKNNVFYGFSSNPNTTSYTDMEYSLETHPTGGLFLIELGTVRVSNIPYSIGDRLKIARSNDTVRYYKNDVVIRTVTGVNKALSLKVDVSFSFNGYVLQNTNTSFCSPIFIQSTKNGFNGTTNTLGSISLNVSGGVSPYTYLWNTGETNFSVSSLAKGIYSVTVTDAINGTATKQYTIGDAVQWASLTGVSLSNGQITKTAGNGWTNGWAIASSQINSGANGEAEFNVIQKVNAYVGLTSQTTDLQNMNYSFSLATSGLLSIVESGTTVLSNVIYSPGDYLRIKRTGSTVSYYRNSSLLRTTTVGSTPVLKPAININGNGQSIGEVELIPQIFTVDNLADTDNNSSYTAGDGTNTLRKCLRLANATSGLEIISFSTSGTITLGSALPSISDVVIIDASTVSGYTAGSPVVEINCNSYGPGLQLASGSAGSTVKGLVINGSGSSGIYINASNNNTITGCFIGTNLAGTAASANSTDGILINGSTGNTIGGTTLYERNLISGNSNSGIHLKSSSGNNSIKGNYIGLNKAGTSAIGNSYSGVYIETASNGNSIGGSTIGAGNTIANNSQYGVYVSHSTGALISNNSIYCNVQKGIALDSANSSKSVPVLSSVSYSQVTGTALAGDVIELFSTQSCTGAAADQGKTYIGTATANGSGDWTYTGSWSGTGITATARDGSNNTSEFASLSALQATISSTNGACGATTGSASTSVSGGIGPYSYLWSNGATTSSISNVFPGLYNVTVTDAQSTTQTLYAPVKGDITWGPSSGLSISGTTVSKTASDDWNNGMTLSSNLLPENTDGSFEFTFNQLGYFQVGLTTTKPNSMEMYLDVDLGGSFRIIDPEGYLITGVSYSVGDVIKIERIGYTVKYYKNNVLVASRTLENRWALKAGIRIFTSGCSIGSAKATFCPPISFSETITDASCSADNGSIAVSVSGGLAPYTYSWSNSNTTNTISNVSLGAYTLTVTDALNSTKTLNYVLGTPATWYNVSDLTQSGGNFTKTGTDSYSTGFATSLQTLPPGVDGAVEFVIPDAANYRLGVTSFGHDLRNTMDVFFDIGYDNHAGIVEGGSYTGVYELYEAGDHVTIERAGSSIKYYHNGKLMRTTTGYAMGRLQVGLNIPNVGKSYPVDGVKTTFCIPITLNPTSTHTECGDTLGTISLNVSGGAAPYTYLWSNGKTSSSISSLEPGSYSVTVTDAKNASVQDNFTVGNPVVWDYMNGVTLSNDVLTKTTNNTFGYSSSLNTMDANKDGSIEFTVSTIGYANIGLADQAFSSSNSGMSYYMDFGNNSYYSTGTMGIVEGNTATGVTVLYKVGDRFKMERVGSTLKYYQNGKLIRQTSISASTVFRAGVRLYAEDYSMPNIITSFCPTSPVSVIASDTTICKGASVTLIASGSDSYSWSPTSTLNKAFGDTVVATPSITTVYTVQGVDSLGKKGLARVTIHVEQADPLGIEFILPHVIDTCKPQSFALVLNEPFTQDQQDSPMGSWGDYNSDGLLDLFVCRGNFQDALYLNTGRGFKKQFVSGLTENFHVGGTPFWGDYNNDGYADLFVSRYGKSDLYKNTGDGSFMKLVTGGIANDTNKNTRSGSWADYDNDGYLDLFVANNYGNDFLYHNNKDGSFSRVTNSPVEAPIERSTKGSWGDYDNDGYMDLFVTVRADLCYLYHNEGNGNFAVVDTGAFSSYPIKANYDSKWIDYDNDGDLDLYICNSFTQPKNLFYENKGHGYFVRDTTIALVTENSDSQGGSAWADMDNDGDLDVYIANVNGQESFLYLNNGNKTFTKVSTGAIVNVPLRESLSAYWADYDNNGFPDLFVANGEVPTYTNYLFKNSGNSNSWLKVRLKGTKSNSSAIGARVRAKAVVNGNSVWQLREITQHDASIAMMGFGNASVIDSLVIKWPATNITQVFTNVKPNQFLFVTEEERNFTAHLSVYEGKSTVLQATGGSSYTWSPSEGLNTTTGSTVVATPSITTTYTVAGINTAGCLTSNSIVIHVSTPPASSVEAIRTVICPGDSVQLSTSGASAYTWTPSTGLHVLNDSTVKVSPSSSIRYSVLRNISGCLTKDSIKVEVVQLHAGNDMESCAGVPVLIGDSTLVNPQVDYTWFPSEGLSNPNLMVVAASPDSTTRYYLRVAVSGQTCNLIDSATVTVKPKVQINAGPDVRICAGTGTALSAGSAQNYSWSPSTGLSSSSVANPTANPSISTIYTLTAIDTNGCESVDYLQVSVDQFEGILQSDTTICYGASLVLDLSGGDAFTYSWIAGENLSGREGATVIVRPDTTTLYKVLAFNGTCSQMDSIRVTVVNLLSSDFTVDQNGLSIELSPESTASGYTWDFGDQSSSTASNPTHTYTTAGEYTICLTVTDACSSAAYCRNIIVEKETGSCCNGQ